MFDGETTFFRKYSLFKSQMFELKNIVKPHVSSLSPATLIDQTKIIILVKRQCIDEVFLSPPLAQRHLGHRDGGDRPGGAEGAFQVGRAANEMELPRMDGFGWFTLENP